MLSPVEGPYTAHGVRRRGTWKRENKSKSKENEKSPSEGKSNDRPTGYSHSNGLVERRNPKTDHVGVASREGETGVCVRVPNFLIFPSFTMQEYQSPSYTGPFLPSVSCMDFNPTLSNTVYPALLLRQGLTPDEPSHVLREPSAFFRFQPSHPSSVMSSERSHFGKTGMIYF